MTKCERLMSQTLTDNDVVTLCKGGSVVVHTGQKRIIVINAKSDILKWLNKKLSQKDIEITPRERKKVLEMM